MSFIGYCGTSAIDKTCAVQCAKQDDCPVACWAFNVINCPPKPSPTTDTPPPPVKTTDVVVVNPPPPPTVDPQPPSPPQTNDPVVPVIVPDNPIAQGTTTAFVAIRTSSTVVASKGGVLPPVATTTSSSSAPETNTGSGATAGIAAGISIGFVAIFIGFFYYMRRSKQQRENQERSVSSLELRKRGHYDESSVDSMPVRQATYVPNFAATAVPAAAAVSSVAQSGPKRSILFVYDTDYAPSSQVCQEIEHVLWAKLAAQQRIVATRRFGIEGLPEDIQLSQLGYFDRVVVVLRKAERFRIYREGKIYARLEELCGDRLTTVVFDVVMQNGNMDAQRHDGFPLVYVSTANKKIIQTPANDATFNELTFQLL
ncbi:hypothetical protein BDR26DRAFT_857212 [Obelidium mucronatum]|nr:hypothetical protein BDR26DRAFT_857212 [Obelidium mucronatum]